MQLSNSEKQRLQKNYGPWAVVTGATSGIGLELARQLASAGIHLIIAARSKERLLQAKQELEKSGIQVITVKADLATQEGIEATIKAAEGPDVGLLINNAGFGTSGPFLRSSIATEVNMLRVNCEAVLALTRHFAERFTTRGKGGIIFLSSLVAFQGVPYAAGYAATKAYVQSLAEALAVELKPHGIAVLAAAPGPVQSGFGERANMKMNNATPAEKVAAPILAALGRSNSIIPGALAKTLAYSLRTVPRYFKVRIMQLVMKGFTQHQTVTY